MELTDQLLKYQKLVSAVLSKNLTIAVPENYQHNTNINRRMAILVICITKMSAYITTFLPPRISHIQNFKQYVLFFGEINPSDSITSLTGISARCCESPNERHLGCHRENFLSANISYLLKGNQTCNRWQRRCNAIYKRLLNALQNVQKLVNPKTPVSTTSLLKPKIIPKEPGPTRKKKWTPTLTSDKPHISRKPKSWQVINQISVHQSHPLQDS